MVDDSVGMVGLVRRHVVAQREAVHAEVEVLALRAFDAHQLSDVLAAVVAHRDMLRGRGRSAHSCRGDAEARELAGKSSSAFQSLPVADACS